MDHPEFFYYAHVRVESHMRQFAQPMDLPSSRWILLDKEDAAWTAAGLARLRRVTILCPEHDKVPSGYLAWYTAPE